MVDWLLKNKEWVFSGAGISVIIAVITLIRWLGKKHNPEAATVVVRIESTPASGSPPDMSSSPIVAVERISSVTPEEIRTSIEAAPPLQRQAVADRYIGLRIEWETKLAHAEQQNQFVKLQLVAQEGKSVMFPVFVWCNVNFSDYRELAILTEGALIRVNGTIESVAPRSVSLMNSRLTFLSAKGGA